MTVFSRIQSRVTKVVKTCLFQDAKICIFERFEGTRTYLYSTSSYVEIPGRINVGTFLGIFLQLDKYVKLCTRNCPILAKNNPISAGTQIAMDLHCESCIYVRTAMFYYVDLYCLKYRELIHIVERTN